MKKSIMLVVLVVYCLGMISCGLKDSTGDTNEEIKEYTATIVASGKEILENNRMRNVIADKTGAKADMKFLFGKTDKELVEAMIQGGKYADFLDGGDGTNLLVEAGVYVPLEAYIEDYPNIKNLFTEEQWNFLRQKDGHIYFIPQFSVVNQQEMAVKHADEAFWIQKKVLKWANYPDIHTLDEYFKLIEDYQKANPVDETGQKTIGFEILCDDWRFFCLENVPLFLAGYPNEGCAIVDADTGEVHDYDRIPEAKAYYKKLSEMYDKGVIRPETFTQSYEQYLGILAEGNVLGMVDQYWQFQDAEFALGGQGKVDCTYVPLSITVDERVKGAYASQRELNTSSGLGITIDCQDVKGALQFIDDLLDTEIMTLRYWGEEGIDYEVDEEGVFYRTSEQRKNMSNGEWQEENFCSYAYFPHYDGLLKDGMNAVNPAEQPGEYYDTMNELDQEILDAYGYEKWTDFLNEPKDSEPWYPLYTATESWEVDAPYNQAKEEIDSLKRQWLPKVIMEPKQNFEQVWKAYMDAYEKLPVDVYLTQLEKEVQRRIAVAEGQSY